MDGDPARRRPLGPATDRYLHVPADRILHDWKEARARALAYLGALGLGSQEHAPLAARAVERALTEPWERGGDAVSETLRALRQLVQEEHPGAARPPEGVPDAFLAWRLERALAGCDGAGRPAGTAAGDGPLRSTPELSRRAMVSEPIERRFLRRFLGRRRRKPVPAAPADQVLYGSLLHRMRRRLPWTRVAFRRRLLLGLLVLVPTIIASEFMVGVLPHQGRTWLEVTIAAFFGALFGWISIGFWTAMLGFLTLVRRRDRFAITNLEPSAGDPPAVQAEGVLTAIVMPISEEPVERVFAGLRAIHRSLERAGALQRFHFFGRGSTGVAPWGASAASSIAAARCAWSARAATSPTSAGAGAGATATWSCSTPTA